MKYKFVFPMPPSQNKALALFRGRFIKTREAREFTDKIAGYRKRNAKALLGIRKEIQQWVSDNDSGVGVDLEFLFSRSSLVCKSKGKQGQLKKIDTDNRIKASLDALSSVLEIDDKYFIGGTREKKWLKEDLKLLKSNGLVILTVYKTSLQAASYPTLELETCST